MLIILMLINLILKGDFKNMAKNKDNAQNAAQNASKANRANATKDTRVNTDATNARTTSDQGTQDCK